MSRKKNVTIYIHIINEVILFVEKEYSLLQDRKNHPTRFPQPKSMLKQCFRWIPKGKRNNVITKIIELCIALVSIEELFDLEGKQATFTGIVTAISTLFGVKIKQLHKLKSQVLERNSTSLLLREMIDAFEQEVKTSIKRKG